MEKYKIRGWIYIAGNSAFKDGYIKIGKTQVHHQERIQQLFRSNVPHPFHVVAVFFCKNVSRAERELHRHLEKYRVNPNREFFDISEDVAKIIVREFLLSLGQLIEKKDAPGPKEYSRSTTSPNPEFSPVNVVIDYPVRQIIPRELPHEMANRISAYMRSVDRLLNVRVEGESLVWTNKGVIKDLDTIGIYLKEKYGIYLDNLLSSYPSRYRQPHGYSVRFKINGKPRTVRQGGELAIRYKGTVRKVTFVRLSEDNKVVLFDPIREMEVHGKLESS
jgi:hypothetical protein